MLLLLLLLVQLILILLPSLPLLLAAGLLIAVAIVLQGGSATLAKTELRLLLGICIQNLTFIRRVFLKEFVIKWVDFDVIILVLILVFN